MSLLTGKSIKFYFGDIAQGQTLPPEIEITGFSPQVQMDEKVTTTSSTTGDGKATTLIRKKFSAKIDAILKTSGGVEITGNTLAVTVGGVAKGITKVDYEVNYDEHNITNSSTPAGFKAFTAVRATYKGKMDLWMEDEADIALSNTAAAVVITLDTNHTITCSAKFSNKAPQGEVNGVSKNSYDFVFQGAPTELGIGIKCGEEKDCVIAFDDGKKISGKAIMFSKAVNAEAEAETKISYNLVFTGTVTEA